MAPHRPTDMNERCRAAHAWCELPLVTIYPPQMADKTHRQPRCGMNHQKKSAALLVDLAAQEDEFEMAERGRARAFLDSWHSRKPASRKI